MTFQTAVDRAIRSENANPQGLPADVLAGMEADIKANPDKYPAITAIFAKMDDHEHCADMGACWSGGFPCGVSA